MFHEMVHVFYTMNGIDLTVFPIRMSVWMKCNDKLNESFIAMPSKIQTAIKKVIWTPQWMQNQLRYLFSID